MRESFDQAVLYIQSVLPEVILYGLLGAVILSVALAFMGRVVFYANYRDLGLSAAMFGLPALVVALGLFWLGAPGDVLFYMAAVVFVPLFVMVTVTTWKANRSLWKTAIVMVGKTTLSFLYVVHLFDALTAKNRSKRGMSWFILAILTPLMFALVADRSGKAPSLPRGGMRT